MVLATAVVRVVAQALNESLRCVRGSAGSPGFGSGGFANDGMRLAWNNSVNQRQPELIRAIFRVEYGMSGKAHPLARGRRGAQEFKC